MTTDMLPLLGYALFVLVFTGFFYKVFAFIIEMYAKENEEDRLSTTLVFIGLSSVLIWYYSRWYEGVVDHPGVTPLLLAVALGLARYKHRDLFKDDDTSEGPVEPSPEDNPDE